jgi:indolepyruvate ferredoxin oxidoreductase, alpha subunit
MEDTGLLSGNEAIARGAWQAGVAFAAGYPGTPSTEILEHLATFKDDLYLEWSPNEKVAFEAAAGAAMAGARSMVTMKHVGLNVAADPLMTLSYMGVKGGFVICVADDPGQHSSQNEQDSRHYARFAKVPVLEPADAAEALEFTMRAFELSEEFRVPVILRTTTRVSHSRSSARLGSRKALPAPVFERDPSRWVPIPLWSRGMRRKVEERGALLAAAASSSAFNRAEPALDPSRPAPLAVIAEGIAYQYAREAFPDCPVLKLGWAWPYPDSLLLSFCEGKAAVLVVEENELILEEHLRSLGVPCHGRDVLSGVGEIGPDSLRAARLALEAKGVLPAAPQAKHGDSAKEEAREAAIASLESGLPARPPVLCPGCPHRGLFRALGNHDVIVTGDIGCYSLAVFPPLSRTDTILCMGGGFSVAQGISKVDKTRRVVGVVGDSTFFHSGITGLVDVAYNKGDAILVVVDNRTTAMTGHQDHPGTGVTLSGEATVAISIEAVARACGMERVSTVNPYDLKATMAAVSEALAHPGPSLIVTRAPCPLRERKSLGSPFRVDRGLCKDCGACLKLGCPAIESRSGGTPSINASLCSGCGLCAQACGARAIVRDGPEGEGK